MINSEIAEFLQKQKINGTMFFDFLLSKGVVEKSTPVDIDKIIRWAGVDVEKNSDISDLIGSAKKVGDKFIIHVNAVQNDFEPRERFTLAHELGHVLLHLFPSASDDLIDDEIENFHPRKEGNWNTKEYEANQFASQLLVPIKLLRIEIQKFLSSTGERDDNAIIEHMAQAFNVSKQAMMYRLINLGVIKLID